MKETATNQNTGTRIKKIIWLIPQKNNQMSIKESGENRGAYIPNMNHQSASDKN